MKIKQNVNAFLLAGCASFTLFFQSCVKDNFEFQKMALTTYEPSMALPLVYSSITINDLLNATDGDDSLLIVNADNSITLVYGGRLLSLGATDVVSLPDQNIMSQVAMDNNDTITLFGVGSVTLNAGDTIDFNTNGTANIDSLFIKSGQLSFNINSFYHHSGNIKVTVPAAKKNGQALSFTSPISYSGTVPVVINKNIDLSGYVFDMTLNGTSNNQFKIDFEITIINSGNPIYPGDNISFSTNINSLQFDKVFGYIGQTMLSPDVDTVDISLFEAATGVGNISFADPKVKITFINSYGLPIEASFNKLDAFSYNSGSTSLTGSGIPNPLPIYSPTVAEIGKSKTGSFTLDKNNSNIATVLNKMPTHFIYQINSKANPAGPGTINFLTDSSKFIVDFDLEIPLHGTIKGFEILDTLEMKIPEIEQLESLSLRAYFQNGFPVDAGIQIIFADSVYNHLDTLVKPYTVIMPGASVSPITGKVTSATTKTNDFTYDKARIEKLYKMKYVIIRGNLSTSSNGAVDVKFYSDYRLDVKLGILAKAKIKF